MPFENEAVSSATLRQGKLKNPEEVALISIAISLKRIADEICGVPYDYAPGADNSKHSAGITAGIQLAIEQGISAASQRG